ncbi:tyrosine-type recombinase/integrase [Streptomyces sp. NPDC056367]|uniref:tyrosine-type recombinase/integrase n=1 Tax=Streptomyces sp. NPDC056367 TaxID=3345797 RepID=UPI0035DF97D1
MPRTHGDPDNPFAGLVFCRSDGRPLGPHRLLDRLRRLAAEAGVPGITVHDRRHPAATITITAGAPLTVVSKTLRHSTPSTTANIYSHLTQQAAHEAVDTIAHTLTGAEKANRPTAVPRGCDHHATTSTGSVSSSADSAPPAPPAFSATADRPRSGRATTWRPPWPRTRERPPSHG